MNSEKLQNLSVILREDTTKSSYWRVKIEGKTFTYNDTSIVVDPSEIKSELVGVKYPKNEDTWSLDAKLYNPLEADRPKNFNYWNEDYLVVRYTTQGPKVSIKFPLFNRCFWYLLAQIHRVPTFEEFAKVYMLAYLRPAKEQSVKEAYTDGEEHCNLLLNQPIKIGECTFTNKLLHFVDDLNVVMPINYLTTEQILYRLTKVYGSVVRDFYHPIGFAEAGAKVIYDSKLDISGGIDMIVNGIACFSYTNTPKGLKFANDKETFRHSDLVLHDAMGDAVAFKLITDIGYTEDIVLPTDAVIKRILKDIEDDNLQDTYRY